MQHILLDVGPSLTLTLEYAIIYITCKPQFTQTYFSFSVNLRSERAKAYIKQNELTISEAFVQIYLTLNPKKCK